MKMCQSRSAGYSWQKGITMVETTIVLPVLILVMLGVIDFGRVMYASITTANAARAAAGYGAQSANLAVDYSGIISAGESDADSLAIDKYNSKPVAVTAERICRCAGETTEVDCINNSCTGAVEVYIEVTADRDFHTVVPYPLIPNSIKLSRTATIRVQ